MVPLVRMCGFLLAVLYTLSCHVPCFVSNCLLSWTHTYSYNVYLSLCGVQFLY
jgi:hypothetical protein